MWLPRMDGSIGTPNRSPAPARGPSHHARASPGAGRPRRDRAAVFADDPDLLTGLDAQVADRLARHTVTPRLSLTTGAWSAPVDVGRTKGCLGLLVLDGALVRSVAVAGRTYPELLGPGDVLRPWDDRPNGSASLSYNSAWRVLVPTGLAVLDLRFSVIVARYPTIMAQLLARSTERARGLAFSLAVTQIRHADTRLLVLLWHLADRWGRMTPDGALVPIPLTHELLASLVSLQRPTASTALQRMRRAGLVDRHRDGSWLLQGEPPAIDCLLADSAMATPA